MSIIIVEDEASEPALFGAMAAAVARQRSARLAQLPSSLQAFRDPDAVQHVAAAGALVASGLIWHERLTGDLAEPDQDIEEVLARHGHQPVVIPHHPGHSALRDMISALVRRAEAAAIPVEHLRVVMDRGRRGVIEPASGKALEGQSGWTRDYYGRLISSENDTGDAATTERLRIGLVGSAHDGLNVYPATVAALGDAADALKISIEIVFIAPIDLRPEEASEACETLDGILLPGGADMANVPGQILTAHASFRKRLPTLGLCLGMQTMVTATAQRILGSREANLAEADPQARIKTFVPIGAAPGDEPDRAALQHRLGHQNLRPNDGTRLAAIIGEATDLRYNHRYRCNPSLIPDLERAGLVISARDRSGMIVDAIEVPDHPFYMGVQGHPELTSRRSRPHPLVQAFVSAAVLGAACAKI